MPRILLVEDDASALHVTALLLSDLGHEVEKVQSLRDAREAASYGRFDLMVLDLNLPDGSGEELLGMGIPAIVLSGYLQRLQNPPRGVPVEYMCKPADPGALAATIKKMCRC